MKMMPLFEGMKTQATRTRLRLGVLLLGLFLATAAPAQFTCITNANNTLTVLGYTGDGGDVIIPNSVDGMPVEYIGHRAFQDCGNLTSITIPSSLVWGNGNPLGILADAFLGCSNLTSIMVDPQNPYYSSVGGVLFDKNKVILVLCPTGMRGSYAILNGATSIMADAFQSCRRLTNITIPSSITKINRYAFDGCSSLTSVTIPNSVTNIGQQAFCNCSNLASVTIPEDVTKIDADAFYNCSSLTSITIPKGVTGLDWGVFWGCSGLTNVYFQGNAPTLSYAYNDTSVFFGTPATAYYLPGTTGWGATFAGIPTVALFSPEPPVIQGNQATLNWLAMPGKACRVEYRADLTSGDWTVVTNLTATQLNASITLPVTGRQGFYRIGMEP